MFGTIGGTTITGRDGDYHWEVRLARREVCDGLNPRTLYKGGGRIVRLVLYRPVGPWGLRRKVAAFDRGWHFGRLAHLSLIRRIVAEVDD